jgi:ABC-2 type transport system permease protein
MTTTALRAPASEPASEPATSVGRARPTAARIPLTRIVGVELRKMFDTRSGFWLMASLVITNLLATAAIIVFAPHDQLTFDNFAAAIGAPMTVILPMIGILAVTSEWSQRSGLTTFTLVPHRGRVIRAKLAVTLAVGLASMALALAIGAVGNVVGSNLAGVDTTWDLGPGAIGYIVGADLLGMLVGFMLGVVTRNSAAAIVGYFVYWFVFPTLSMLLAANNAWFEKAQPWLDFSFKQNSMYDGGFTGQDWAQLALTGSVWLLLPLAFGVWRVLRSEVK